MGEDRDGPPTTSMGDRDGPWAGVVKKRSKRYHTREEGGEEGELHVDLQLLN